MAINEQDAFQVFNAYKANLIPDELKPKAKQMLDDYRSQQVQRMQSVFGDLKTLDAEDGSFITADRFSPRAGDKLRKKEANILWLSNRYNAPETDVRKRYDLYKAEAATEWGQAGLDDESFFSRASQEVGKQKKQIQLIQSAQEAAFLSAVNGGDDVADFSAWQFANPDPESFTGTARSAWEEERKRTLNRLGPDGQGLAARVVRSLRHETGVAREEDAWLNQTVEMLTQLKATDPDKYNLVMAVANAKAQKAAKPEKGIAEGAVEAFGRSSADIIAGIPRMLVTTAGEGSAMLAEAGITTAENPELLAKRIRARSEIQADLQDLARGVIDPIESRRKGWAKYAEDAVYMFAGSAPTMVAPLIPGGQAALTGMFANESYEDFRRAGWDGPGALGAALATGRIQAAIERVSESAMAIPGVASWMAKYGAKPGMSFVKTFLARTAARSGVEFGEEFAQQVIGPAAQELGSAIISSIPDRPEGMKFRDVVTEFVASENSIPLLLSVLPLGALGAGMSTQNDMVLVATITRDPRLLRAVMSESEAKKIEQEANPQVRAEMIKKAWQAAPTSDIVARIKALVQDDAKRVEEAKNVLAEAEKTGLIPRIRRDAEGWKVEQNGQMVRVDSREAAVQMAYSSLDDLERQQYESMALVADELLNDQEAMEISGSQQTLKGLVDAKLITPQEAAKRAQLAAQMAGMTQEEAQNASWIVLGKNTIEQINNVRTAVSRIYRGANVITQIHEHAHGRWATALNQGYLTHDDGVQFVRLAEQATGLQFLPVADDAKVSPQMLDEAIVEVVSADTVGRRKTDRRFTPGVISRGIAAFIKSQKQQQLGERAAGKMDERGLTRFNAFMSSYREFWGVVLRNARALKKARDEGKIGEDFDTFLEALLGTDTQTRVEAEAIQEVGQMVEEVDNQPFSLSRATPADTSKIVQMPDGAQLVGPTSFSIRAYHGTPHKVDRFSTSKIGTGEGAQAYGWGLYFAESRAVGEQYQRNLSAKKGELSIDGKPYNGRRDQLANDIDMLIADAWHDIKHDVKRKPVLIRELRNRSKGAFKEWKQRFKDAIEKAKSDAVQITGTDGNLYTVELLPDADEFLDWDKPLSEQSEKVKAALDKAGISQMLESRKSTDFPDVPLNVYSELAWDMGEQKASKYLASLGIPGIRYLDGGSRGAGDGTRNYVIFDENLVKILEENGKPVEGTSFSLALSRTAQDAEYLAAVKAGDMEKAQRMVDEAAKAAGFGLGPMWHTTRGARKAVFERNLQDPSSYGVWFFSPSKESVYSRGREASTLPYFLKTESPVFLPPSDTMDLDFKSQYWVSHDSAISFKNPSELDEDIYGSNNPEQAGKKYGIYEVVIRDPSQIKSADPVTYDDEGNVIPLSQRFQPESQDIRFSLAPARTAQDAEYLAAVESGDMEKAQQMVDAAAKAAGYEIQGWHGSAEDFTEFKIKHAAMFAAQKEKAAKYGDIVRRFYLKSKAPAKGVSFQRVQGMPYDFGGITTWAKQKGRDSAATRYKSKDGEIAIFSPSQIKSADPVTYDDAGNVIPLSQRFQPESQDIRFSLARATSLVEVADTILASRMKKPEFKEGFYIAARRRLERLAKQKNMQGQGARESQLGAIRTLNAILSAFSPAIRGEVVGGNMGFINLAELKTDAARAKEITRVLNKLEDILEREAKKYYTEKIERMLERAQLQGKPGEVKKSDFIVTVQDELNLIQLAVDLDTDEVQAGITAAEAELMTADTPEKADSAMARMHLLETFGALFDEKNTTSVEMEVASDYLEQLMKQGREARSMLDEERRKKVKSYVEAASKDVFNGEIGPDTTQEARMKAAKKSGRTLLKKFFQEGLSYDLVLRYLFGADSKTAQEFGDRFILNSNAFEDTQNERRKRLRDFSRELYKTKLGARINQKLMALDTKQANTGVTYLKGREVVTHKMDLDQAAKVVADPKAFGFTAADAKAISAELDAINTRNADPTQRKVKRLVYEQTVKTGDRVEIPLSQMDALYLSMALRQPGILEQQERYGYDQKTVDELENFLTDEAKSWREWMQEEYDAEYDVANQVYMRLFNTRMPQIKFYAPLLKNHQGNQAALDPLNSGLVAQSANPGSIKSRKARTSSLRIESALDVFWSHFNQMDYWVHMAEYLRDVQSVMLNPTVRDAVVSKHGTEGMQTLNAWITLQLGRGVGKGALVVAGNRMIRNIKSAVSMKALALNLSTTLKTLPSMLYSLGEIHLSKWPAALASGMKHWSRLWNTNIIQRRLDIGGMPELRDLGNSALPMSWINQGIRYGSYPTMYADGVFTTYSAAMAYGVSFDEAKAQGASDEMAHKYAEERTAIIVSKTAQPENWTQKSLLENDASGAGTLFYLFTSDPRQKAALTFEVFNRLRKGEASLEEVSRKFLAYWVLPGMMFQLANAVGRSLFKGDDDEWDVVDFATAALVGQAQGFLLIGSSLEMIVSAAVAAAAEAITGEEVKGKPFWNSPKNPLDQAAQEMVKAAQTLNEDDGKTGLEKAWQLGKAASMGMSWMTPAGAIPSTAERVLKDTSNLFYSEED